MSNSYSLYEDVAEGKGAKPMVELLPYIDNYGGNFSMDTTAALKYSLYVNAIYKLVTKYSEALESVISNTINPAERIIIYAPYCDEAMSCIYLICKKSPHNCIQMKKFITLYGNVECKKNGSSTTYLGLIEKEGDLMTIINNATIII